MNEGMFNTLQHISDLASQGRFFWYWAGLCVVVIGLAILTRGPK